MRYALVLLICIGVSLLGGFLGGYVGYKSVVIGNEGGVIVSDSCDGSSSLFQEVGCLRNDLLGWYDYNISNINKDFSLDELKKYGGVCRHYADWYAKSLKNAGFEARYVVFTVNSTMSHAIAIGASNDGYCLLDQIFVNCWKWK